MFKIEGWVYLSCETYKFFLALHKTRVRGIMCLLHADLLSGGDPARVPGPDGSTRCGESLSHFEFIMYINSCTWSDGLIKGFLLRTRLSGYTIKSAKSDSILRF